MFWLAATLKVLLGYLAGSVSFAILVARWVIDVDIREVGNKNPGAANVLRSVGIPWGILVGALDGLKALVPMWLVQHHVMTTWGPAEILTVFAVGAASIVGHCKPIFHGFDGGKGAGPFLGILIYFVFWESLLTFVISTTVVVLFVRGVAHRWSRWGPIVAISIGPFLLGVLEVLGPLTAGPVTLGDNGWPVVLGVFSSSMVILGLNYTFMSERVVELKDEQAL